MIAPVPVHCFSITFLGRHMNRLADSIAKLSQGRENWYTGREGIPVDDSSAYIVTKNPLGIKIEIFESQHFPKHYGGNR